MKYLTVLSLMLVSFGAISQIQPAWVDHGDNTFLMYKRANELLYAGDTKKALAVFDKVADYFIKENKLTALPEHYLGTALSLALSGHYSASIRYHKKALRAHRKYKSTQPDEAISVNLGLVYQLAGKDRKSKRHLGKNNFS